MPDALIGSHRRPSSFAADLQGQPGTIVHAATTQDSRVRYQPTIGAPNATMMTSPASSSRQRAYLVIPQDASRSPCPGGGGGAGMTG